MSDGVPTPTRRATASIVILAWNEWEHTKACLESLRPTLQPTDEVIVVDNGSRDRTPAGLRQLPWVRTITNEENRGFAAGCNQGAAVATGDVVVFLNNDTVLTRRWLDALVAPFADPSVGATGARSNFVSGPQLVPEAVYDPAQRSQLRAFAERWREANRGRTSDTDRLVGFCLAVRRTAFEAVGGFDEGYGIGGFEDDDLCASLRAAGHRLLIVHDSFVHHDGHVTFNGNGLDWMAIQQENERRFLARHGTARAADEGVPLVSACLITRDEEELLPGCLDSILGFADEVVVYDTGSVDGTVALARERGATVVEGHWDDDFARARNEALARCRGVWVLHIDADERLVLNDGEALRRQLGQADGIDGRLLRIGNLGDDGRVETEHRACRLFRRVRGQWHGRLHEQVLQRPGQAALVRESSDLAWIEHLGYQSEIVVARSKGERNVRLAEADLDDVPYADRPLLLLNLARSLVGDGRMEDALARCEEALALRGPSIARPGVLRVGAEVLCALGRPAEALEWVAELRAVSSNTAICDFLEGSALLQLGENQRAADLLSGVEEVWDDLGLGGSRDAIQNRRVLALIAAERWEDAADELLAMEAPLALRGIVAQVLLAQPVSGDHLGEAMWKRSPGDARLVALGAHLGRRLPLERCMEWAARVRATGLDEHCPLVARATDDAVDPAERIRCAAVAATGFGDDRAVGAVRDAAAALAPERFELVLVELDQLAPALLPSFVAAAVAGGRHVEMAASLRRLGADEQAAAVEAAGENPLAIAQVG